MMAVCLIVTLPGIPLNFDTLTVILIVVLADSPFNFDTSAKDKNYCQRMQFGGAPLKFNLGRSRGVPGGNGFGPK